jgi:hypothetical protein
VACVFWNKKATTEYEALPPVHPSAVSIGLPNRWSKLPDKRAGFELRLSKAFFPKTGEPQISASTTATTFPFLTITPQRRDGFPDPGSGASPAGRARRSSWALCECSVGFGHAYAFLRTQVGASSKRGAYARVGSSNHRASSS